MSREISHATTIQAGRETVYEAVIAAAALDSWFGEAIAPADAREGRSRIPWKRRATGAGPLVESARPSRLVLRRRPDPSAPPTTVEITLEDSAGGTVVQVREHGFASGESGMRAVLECGAGWRAALKDLKRSVEGAPGR